MSDRCDGVDEGETERESMKKKESSAENAVETASSQQAISRIIDGDLQPTKKKNE